MKFPKINFNHEAFVDIIKLNNEKSNFVKSLLETGNLPEQSLDEKDINHILYFLSHMDSNNHSKNLSMGEREGRIFSNIVSSHNFNFGHGVGRSGDLSESQPKAAGSSLIYKLSNRFLEDAFKISGLQHFESSFIIPMPMEMTLNLCIKTLALKRPDSQNIIFIRNDKESIFKSLFLTGFKVKIIDKKMKGWSAVIDFEELELFLNGIKNSNILCLISSIGFCSVFNQNQLLDVGKLCQIHDIPHLMVGYKSIFSKLYSQIISSIVKESRLDIYMEPSHHSFMAPPGGTIIASPSNFNVKSVLQNYSGRASASPILDVFISLLQLGKNKITKIIDEKASVVSIFQNLLNELEIFRKLFSISPDSSDNFIIFEIIGKNDNFELLVTIFMDFFSSSKMIMPSQEISKYDKILKNWSSSISDLDKEFLIYKIPKNPSIKHLISQVTEFKNYVNKNLANI